MKRSTVPTVNKPSTAAGHDQVIEGIEEERKLPVQKRVDGVEPGYGPGWAETRAEPPPVGEPAEAVVKKVEHEQRHPERRHRNPEQADHAKATVDRAAPADGGQDAEADTEHGGDDDGEKSQFHRGREVLAEVGSHGAMALLGHAQVEVDQLPQVDEVLHRHRLVQAVLVVEGFHDRRVPERRLAQVGRGRVTRDKVGEDEGNQGDPDHQDNADPQPPGQEPPEPGGCGPPGSVPVDLSNGGGGQLRP